MTKTFTTPLTHDMKTWTSPNGVEHLIDDRGRCVTCGKPHEDAFESTPDRRVIEAEAYVRTRFYPPLPHEYGRYAVDAVDACNEGEPGREILLNPDLPMWPKGATFDESGSVSVTAEELVDVLRLWHLVDEL